MGAAAIPERLGDEILVGERHDRDSRARQTPDLRREHPAGVDDDFGLDVTPFGADAADAAIPDLDSGDAGVGEDLRPTLAGAVGERVGELRRVEVAVGRQVRGGADAVDLHQRKQLLSLLRREPLQRQPERPRPCHLAVEFLLALVRTRKADPAAFDPSGIGIGLCGEPPVQLNAVHHHPRQRDRPAELADETGGVERRAARELVAIDEHDVALAELGEVIRDRGPADAATDDDDPGAVGKVTRTRHQVTFRGFGSERASPRGRAQGGRGPGVLV